MSAELPTYSEGVEPFAPPAENYRQWGVALGQKVTAGAKFLVASTFEALSDQRAGLCDGLCAAGLDVVDLGALPGPMIDYARGRLHAAGSALVLPSETGEASSALRFALGEFAVDDDEAARAVARSSKSGKRKRTCPRPLDVTFDYVAWLQETWVEPGLTAELRVVIDPVHGAMAARARRYLSAIFPRCLFSTIHDQPDPALSLAGVAGADVADLCDEVDRHRAHLGIAFDPAGDRLIAVDDHGVVLSADEVAWIFLRAIADRLRGRKVVCDARLSSHVAQAAISAGAEPVRVFGSRNAICRATAEGSAILGADGDGHFFFESLGGAHDALFAACQLIAAVASSGEWLSELRAACPRVYMTPDLRVEVDPREHAAVVKQIRDNWSEFPQESLGALRIETPGGWVLVSCREAQPQMTFRFEGLDWHALDDLVDRFCDTLG
ncbi:MAG: hypothetical protein ACOY3P_02875, partial [Planctomycetota bacterium]